MPRRFPLAPEDRLVPYEVRSALVGSVTLLFTIDDARTLVRVIGVRGQGQLPRSGRLPHSIEDPEDTRER